MRPTCGWLGSRVGLLHPQLQLPQLSSSHGRQSLSIVATRELQNLEYNATRSLGADVIGEKRMEIVDVGMCVLELVLVTTKSMGW
jgi:hypothetical protein